MSFRIWLAKPESTESEASTGGVLQNRFMARKSRFLSNNACPSPAYLLQMNYFTDFHKVFWLQRSKL